MRYHTFIALMLLCALRLPVQAQDDTGTVDLQPPSEEADVLVLISRGLDELPDELFGLDWFTALSIGNHSVWIHPDDYVKQEDNTFSELPPEIGRLQQLKILEITNGSVSELPAEMGQLQNLESLILVNLPLDTLPPEIGLLENLRTFNLRGNQLSSLPVEMSHLTNLEAIDLSGNNFTEVPPVLYELPGLETAMLQNNPIPANEIERLNNHLQNGAPDNTIWLIAGVVALVVGAAGVMIYQRRRR